MKLIYVAGPFSAPTAWGIAENVRAAERVGLEIARAGAMPVIPHANTHLFHGEGPHRFTNGGLQRQAAANAMNNHFWLEGTMELLKRCDGAVFLPTWVSSTGAVEERKMCTRLDMPVLELAHAREVKASFFVQITAFIGRFFGAADDE